MGLYYHGQLKHDTLWSPKEARDAATRHGCGVLDARYANMLPLTLDHPLATGWRGRSWRRTGCWAEYPA
jgi:hypothetical protein